MREKGAGEMVFGEAGMASGNLRNSFVLLSRNEKSVRGREEGGPQKGEGRKWIALGTEVQQKR